MTHASFFVVEVQARPCFFGIVGPLAPGWADRSIQTRDCVDYEVWGVVWSSRVRVKTTSIDQIEGSETWALFASQDRRPGPMSNVHACVEVDSIPSHFVT